MSERAQGDLIGTKLAAERLGLTAASVRRECAAGRIEGAIKIGRDWLMPDPPRRTGRVSRRTRITPGTADRIRAANLTFNRHGSIWVKFRTGQSAAEIARDTHYTEEDVAKIIAQTASILARNLEILRSAEKGLTHDSIGRDHGISGSRVSQIVALAAQMDDTLRSAEAATSGTHYK